MAPNNNDDDQQLELLTSLLTSLRNAKATFGENSAKYLEMKAWVDEHISASGATSVASTQEMEEAARPADNNATSSRQQQQQQQQQQQEERTVPQHVFNLAFRPRPQGVGYAQ